MFLRTVFIMVFGRALHKGSSSVVLSEADGVFHNPSAFLRLYNFWYEVCNLHDNNAVPFRFDGHGAERYVRGDNKTIPWSLSAEVIHDFVGERACVPQRPPCYEVADMLRAILSFPHHRVNDCRISWYSSKSVCRIMEKYSSVLWIGDSLTRHMAGALTILLSDDWRFGLYPQSEWNSEQTLPSCGCDGQFSEALICRPKSTTTYSFDTLGYCSHLSPYSSSMFSFFQVWHLHEDHDFSVLCKQHHDKDEAGGAGAGGRDRGRLRFVFLGGGTHYGWNASETFHKFIIHNLRAINDTIQSSACRAAGVSWDTFRFVFMGVPIVHHVLREKYPRQSSDRVLTFNTEMRELVARNVPTNFYIIDFTNMTNESVWRTSDGFHSLTDVNLMKTMSLLNIMHLLSTS